jgi:hypothetical protein
MTTENTKTFYSTNDEIFDKENVGEIIDDLYSDNEVILGINYYSHEFKLVDLKQYLNVDGILEHADEWLYDNVGSDDGGFDVFTDVTKEAKQELSLLLNSWVEKHLSNRNIYEAVGKSTTHIITQDDLG